MSEHAQNDADGPQPVGRILRDMVSDGILDDAKRGADGRYTVWRNGAATTLDRKVLRALAARNWRSARLWVFLETEHIPPGETRDYPIFADTL